MPHRYTMSYIAVVGQYIAHGIRIHHPTAQAVIRQSFFVVVDTICISIMDVTFDFDTELRSYGVDPAVKCLARKRTSLTDIAVILPALGYFFESQRSELAYGFYKPSIFVYLSHVDWPMVLLFLIRKGTHYLPQRHTHSKYSKYYIRHNLAY